VNRCHRYPAGKAGPVGVLVVVVGVGLLLGDGLLDPDDDPEPVLGVGDGWPDG
jgi:hypothetical protein